MKSEGARCLLIETSTERPVAGFFLDSVCLFQAELPFGYSSSRKLLTEIEKGIQRTGWSIPSLDFIGIGTGPGSYTGMRVGAVTAQSLAYASKIPLITLSTLECFEPKDEGVFAVAIDARIGGMYLQKGEKTADGIMYFGLPALIPLDKWEKVLEGIASIITPHSAPLLSRFLAMPSLAGVHLLEQMPDLERMNSLANKRWLRGEKINPLTPLDLAYLRKTQAEMELHH